jgi:hypothetical protein
MTFDSTHETVVIGEDFTSKAVVGVLDPSSLAGAADDRVRDGALVGLDVLRSYRLSESAAHALRASGIGVSIVIINVATYLTWCDLEGTDPADPATVQAAASAGVSDDIFEFEGSLSSVMRARYVRDALLVAMIPPEGEEEVKNYVGAKVAEVDEFFRLIMSNVEGYYQLVISLDVSPSTITPSMNDYSGLTSVGQAATALFSGLSDGRGETFFETDADRSAVLGLLGLVNLGGGTVLIRRLGDQHNNGGRGVSVCGWRVADQRIEALEEVDALLLQYALGGGVDEGVSFIAAPPRS